MPREPRSDDLARAAAGDPPEPLYTKADALGIVKYWRNAKGNGAIASEATAPWDIWCSFWVIEMDGFKALVAGERVHVHYHRANQESFRYVADLVRRLDAGCGPVHKKRSRNHGSEPEFSVLILPGFARRDRLDRISTLGDLPVLDTE